MARLAKSFLFFLIIQLSCFQAMAADHVSTVLMGDSEMYGWLNYPILMTSNVNLSIPATFAATTYNMTPTAASYTPDKIFMLTGTNDVQWGSQDTFASTYDSILNALQTMTPSTKVYVSSLLPVNWTDFPMVQYTSNAAVQAYNNVIAQVVSTHPNAAYINSFPFFTDQDGNLNKTLSLDGIHLNQAGYTLWSNLLSPYY